MSPNWPGAQVFPRTVCVKKDEVLVCDLRYKRPTQTQREFQRTLVSLYGRLSRYSGSSAGLKAKHEHTRWRRHATPGAGSHRVDIVGERGRTSQPTAHPNERLDWASYLARFYPHVRSHDYESLAA